MKIYLKQIVERRREIWLPERAQEDLIREVLLLQKHVMGQIL